jgi:hypothetical protein
MVNGIDQLVTPPANKFVRTNMFADSVAMMTRLEVRIRRRLERQSTWWLHQWNMPAATDIRKIRAQLAALEARMRDMGETLEDQRREARSDGKAAASASSPERPTGNSDT